MMIAHFRTPPTLTRDYYFIGILCTCIVLLVIVIKGSYTYYSQKAMQYKQLEMTADHIESFLSISFNYVSQMARMTGERIRETALHDNAKISAILSSKDSSNEVTRNLFSWPMFDWITEKNQLTVVGWPVGVLNPPRDMSHRYYVKMAPVEPWKLHFDEPSLGIPSGIFIVPMGMGITNSHGQLVGITAAGFDIEKISAAITREIEKDNVSFLVLTKHQNIAFLSRDNRINTTQRNFFSHYFATNAPPKDNYGKLEPPIILNEVTYFYYKKLPHYPYTILVGYNQHYIHKAFYDVLVPSILAFTTMGLVCAVIMFFMRRMFYMPVMQLVDIADSIARGEHHIPMLQSNRYEIQHLSNQLKKIIDYTHEINGRTTKLQEALNTREEFLNNMSHEIRIPAGNVMGMAGMMLEDWEELDDETRKAYAHDIFDNCKRLYVLLSNLLDLSKSRAGKMTYTIHPYDLIAITELVLSEARFTYTAKNLRVVFLKPEQGPMMVRCDQLRIGQVIWNLLSNAIKFTAAGTLTITIKPMALSAMDGQHVTGVGFILQDEGIGIPEDELTTIFDVFKQSSRTKTRAGGTGLGLSVCREIITSHHGVIWAENNTTGKGSTFTFILPMATIDVRHS